MGYTRDRATWQIMRRTATNPGVGSSTVVATIGMSVIATMLGTKIPAKVLSQSVPGAAFEFIDAYAFLSVSAASIVQHRDTMIHVETQDRYEVVQIQGFPNVTQVSLRQIKTKSIAVQV